MNFVIDLAHRGVSEVRFFMGTQNFFFVPRSDKTKKKHLSLFLYRAQNLPPLLFLSTHLLTTTTEANNNATPTTTATIPHIEGISENISRILRPFNIRVANKPIKPFTTRRQLLTNVKEKDEPRYRQGAVYKINRSDYHASYIGETDRNLTTRLTEHKLPTRKGDVNNHIAEYHRLTYHTIDWDSVQCLYYSTNYFQ